MSDIQTMSNNCVAFARQHLKECCAELIEWQDTAVLRKGKVRELANIAQGFIADHDALKAAEAIINRVALELATAAPTDAKPDEPNMLWWADDNEVFANGPDEFAEDYATNCLRPGEEAEVRVDCAYRGNQRTMRIAMVEKGDDAEVVWKWADSPAAAQSVRDAAQPTAATAVALVPKWEGEFKNFEQWVNKAQSWLTSPSHRPAVCIDAMGRRCAIGKDFMLARDEGAFPVRFFWECQPIAPGKDKP